MINKEIIKLASNTTNVGLGSKYSHRIFDEKFFMWRQNYFRTFDR